MGQKARILICFIVSVFITVSSNFSVHALANYTDREKTIWKETKNIFWNPYGSEPQNTNGADDAQCFPKNSDTDNSGDHWDGHCDGVGSYSAWINKHLATIQKIAKANGIPWEAFLAQTIKESSGGKNEVCPFNPLGLKTNDKSKACDARMHRSFSSYEEAFQYYIDSIIPVREAKHKYPNDPYMYIEYIQHGATYRYAQSLTYANSTSGLICGIQKWAEANGHGSELSSKTYKDYPNGIGGSGSGESSGSNDTTEVEIDGVIYICPPGVKPDQYSDIDPTVEEDSGLTYEQARQLVIWYGANKNNSSVNATGATLWNKCNGGGSNCVTFSSFFTNKFTSKTNYSGNGNAFAGNIGVPMGKTPQIFSVFSSSGHTDGHTGVVLGYHGGKWIVAHASCSRDKRGAGNGTKEGDGSAFVIVESNFNPNNGGWSYPGSAYSNYRFAYLKDYVDINKISEYLKNGF